MMKVVLCAAVALCMAQAATAQTVDLRYYFHNNITIRDSSGRDYNTPTQAINTPLVEGYVPGCSGVTALEFNGVDSKVTLPSEAITKHGASSKLVFFFRFKVADDAFTDGTIWRALWSAVNSQNQIIIRIAIRNNGQILFSGSGASWCGDSVGSMFTIGQWSEVVVKRIGNKFYLNVDNHRCQGSYDLSETKADGHILGDDSSPMKPFKGLISDFIILNKDFDEESRNMVIVNNRQTCKGSHDLVMHFPMKTVSEKDISGNEFNALSIDTGITAPTHCDENRPNAIHFPSTKHNIIKVNGDLMQGLVESTFAVWFKTPYVLGSYAFFGYGTDSTANVRSFGLFQKDRFWFDTNIGRRFTSNTNINQGEWNHVALVTKGNYMYVYLNGQEVKTQNLVAPGVVKGTGETKKMVIGALFNNNFEPKGAMYVGYMYDFRMYQVPLSEAAVQQLADPQNLPKAGCAVEKQKLWHTVAVVDSFTHNLWESLRPVLDADTVDLKQSLWRTMAITDSFVHNLWQAVRTDL